MRALVLLVATLASVMGAVAPSPVTGGTGFGDAPLLGPGQSGDTVDLGSVRWYGVALADGQRLDLAVTVSGGPDGSGGLGGPGEGAGGQRRVEVALYSPREVAVAPLPASADLDGSDDVTVTTRTAVVGDGPAAAAPGTWYASVALLDGAPSEPAPAPPPAWPVTLDVAVTQTRPATTTVLQGLTTTTPAAEDAPTAGEDREALRLGPPLGAAAAGLAVGALGGVAVARRRSGRRDRPSEEDPQHAAGSGRQGGGAA